MTTDASPASPPPWALAGMAIVFVGYFGTMHALIASGERPLLALGFVALPWILALLSSLTAADADLSARKLRRAGAVVALVAICGLGWRFAADLAPRADLLLYLENLAFMLGLAIAFATSLRSGRDALVTRLARVMRHGDMPPSVVRYTRTVTIVWAGYFATLALVSSLLFFTQPRATWSAYVNLAIWPLVAGGFVLEYAIRRLVLRDVRHIPMMAGVQAFRHHGAAERRVAPGVARGVADTEPR